MKNWTLFLMAMILVVPMRRAVAQSNISAMVAAMKQYEQDKDDLAIRVMVKRIARANPAYGDWIRVRQLLERRPSIGYGLLYSWDRLPYRGRKSPYFKFEEK